MTTPTQYRVKSTTPNYNNPKILQVMNTTKFYAPEATAAATFSRLRVVIASLRETTLTPDRRAWFEKTRDEFRYLLTLAAAYTFNAYQMGVINNGADDFNEGELYYMGATIAAPSLHYSE